MYCFEKASTDHDWYRLSDRVILPDPCYQLSVPWYSTIFLEQDIYQQFDEMHLQVRGCVLQCTADVLKHLRVTKWVHCYLNHILTGVNFPGSQSEKGRQVGNSCSDENGKRNSVDIVCFLHGRELWIYLGWNLRTLMKKIFFSAKGTPFGFWRL